MEAELEGLIEKLKSNDKSRVDEFLLILEDMNLGDEQKIAGLVYMALRKGIVSLEKLKYITTKEVFASVEILNKLDNLNYSQQQSEAENLRKMFFAITKDIRIIMLKIAFVTTNLRHVDEFDADYQRVLAQSIFSLYAPLSARLGLSSYKTELENGAFLILNPDKYNEIQNEVDMRFHKRQPIVERLIARVKSTMQELNIKGKVFGRKKHIYSIYKKLLDHNDLDHIYDLIAVRAIVGSVAECYALLGKLHSEMEPIAHRFKDYVATPKPNGYQSLHTTVKFEGFPVEIQIRTTDMNKYAEYGVAAHWMYKEKRKNQDTLDIQLAWLRQMMDDEEVNIDQLADSLNQDIYNNEIFVQTPKGKVIYLPTGSTPIDFAYAIHSEVGNKFVGAKVNTKMVANNHKLNNGDVVEVITNPNSKGPSRDWLKICKTSNAKNKINTFFKKNMKEENIKIGKSMLENAIKEKGYAVNKLMTNDFMKDIFSYYGLSNLDELYANIGTNALSAKVITNRLVQSYQKHLKISETTTSKENNVTLTAPTDKQIELKGLNNILIKFARCCQPMYGDKIVGFISAGRGVIIHRDICPNLVYFDEKRLIEANWKMLEMKHSAKKLKSKSTKSKISTKLD